MDEEGLATIILAAGQGTRMRSKHPKVLHQLAGKPMLQHVLDTLATLAPARTILIIGHHAEEVRRAAGHGVECILQEPQLGTGHAVLQARDNLLGRSSTVLVLYGDTPLLRPATLTALLARHYESSAAVTVLTSLLSDPAGYGRIVRDGSGEVRAVVEESDCGDAERAIREVNSGVYCFQAGWLWSHLDRLPERENGEYYLTDLVAGAIGEGLPVKAVPASEPAEALGINTREQLAEADAVLRWRVRRALMLSGVTLVDPASTYVDATATIGQDTVIYPNTIVEGATVIGEDCVIGPNTYLRDARIGRDCRVLASLIEDSSISECVIVGPFAHLRGGAEVGARAEIGNFSEIKRSVIGPGTKMHHFSYLGDAMVGARVNIGAGTITCNFNSETQTKSQTIIEDGAALGSDTMLVAPVRVGKDAITGAGSVVTRDIPDESVASGVPAKVTRKVRRGKA